MSTTRTLSLPLVRLVFPEPALARDLLLALTFSLLIALAARLSLPLPFTPVPLTGQTLAVLLTGAALGARGGALSVMGYLLMGILGLPVFAASPVLPHGVLRLIGPTGGYLLAYLPAAVLVGWLAEHGWDRRYGTTFLGMAAANLLILTLGTLWLARVGRLTWSQSLLQGFLPFLPGDLVKILVATALLPTVWRRIDRAGVRRKVAGADRTA